MPPVMWFSEKSMLLVAMIGFLGVYLRLQFNFNMGVSRGLSPESGIKPRIGD
jgi:hypothetical protein